MNLDANAMDRLTKEDALALGARNLVVNCACLKPDETVLIVHEDPSTGWYDNIVPQAVAVAVREIGIEPDFLDVGAPGSDSGLKVSEAVASHDCTIFFARIGDQDRFAELPSGVRAVMCYARDAQLLASAYGRTDHRAFYDLKTAVNQVLFGAKRIEITCPLGTEISGRSSGLDALENGDVSVLRFPLGVPQPMAADSFSGRVALAHYLTPTGSRVYEPASLALDEPVFAYVKNGRIERFEGNTLVVERVRQHYKNVAKKFSIDADAVHSWHAGIHPASAYPANAKDDPDRWSNTIFTNPRFLHFHTCGAYAPGEICWMVLDHTITVDGVNLWENGRLRATAFNQTRTCLENRPELAPVFAQPSNMIGISG